MNNLQNTFFISLRRQPHASRILIYIFRVNPTHNSKTSYIFDYLVIKKQLALLVTLIIEDFTLLLNYANVANVWHYCRQLEFNYNTCAVFDNLTNGFH